MTTARIRKDDLVVVIAGKNKGSQGRVLRVLHETDRVIVEGVNRVKRHQGPTRTSNEGQIIEKEASVHISNVMPLDSKTKKPTRVRTKVAEGKKIRIAAKSGAAIEGA